MDDDELLKNAFEIYEAEMNSRNNDDYKVNDIQMKKLMDAYNFFVEIAKRGGGTVDKLEINPKEENGYVTAYFTLFYMDDQDIIRLSKIVKSMVSLSIDCTLDYKVCISFTIPNVYYKFK